MVKVLYWDVETSAFDVLHRTYQLKQYSNYLSHRDIVRDWTMLSCAWSYMHEEEVHCVSIRPDDPLNDKGIITHIHRILDDADVLVGHNSDKFDLKKFNARAMYYGLNPIIRKPSETVDTLKVAKKVGAFTSNSLEYLVEYFDIPDKKMEPPDWDEVLLGNREEIRYMREYNKADIVCGKELYKKFLPADDRHPNVSRIINQRDTSGKYIDLCPRCGSANWVSNGHKYNAKRTKIKKRIKCLDCHSTPYSDTWETFVSLKGLL